MIERPLARSFGKQTFAAVATNADAGMERAIWPENGPAQQCEVVILEPGEQCTIFCWKRLGIREHRRFECLPISHRIAQIGQALFDAVADLDAITGISTVCFNIDDRLRFPVLPDRDKRALGVTRHADHRMEQPINHQPLGRNNGRNRINKERHVRVDDRKAHPSSPVGFGDGIDCQARLPASPHRERRKREFRSRHARLRTKSVQVSRQGACDQRFRDGRCRIVSLRVIVVGRGCHSVPPEPAGCRPLQTSTFKRALMRPGTA